MALHTYERMEFNQFFEYVCSLPHIKELVQNSTDTLKFQGALSDVVYFDIKQGLKQKLWSDGGETIAKWFGLEKSHGPLKKICEIPTVTFSPQKTYRLEFSNKIEIKTLNEKELYKSIYTDEALYDSIGAEGCIAMDIAMAKGGTEAIAESYYSVMASQQQSGPQENDTLALR